MPLILCYALTCINIILDAMTGTIAFVLALLFFFGLIYSEGANGKTIMRAIIMVWTAVGVHQFAMLVYDIRILIGEEAPMASFGVLDVPIDSILLCTFIYYLWATVRRNPPSAKGHIIASRKT